MQDDDEAIYQRAVSITRQQNRVSTSLVQRTCVISYNWAGQLLERMEREGIITSTSPDGKVNPE